jgi:hypothetical protein
MSNREVAGLQALAKQHGGNLSVNPDTGLPEAGFLDSLLPTIAGAGLTYFTGMDPVTAGALVGGITALDSKDLSKGLMAGLGAWGGAGLTSGLMTAGTGTLEGAAAAQGAQAGESAISAGSAANASNWDKLSAGTGQLFSNPGQTMTAIGGGSPWKAAGVLGAAAAPIIADEMVETTTEAPPQDRGKIRPYTYSRQQTYAPQGYQAPQENIGSKERRWFNDSYTAGEPYSAAGGGLVALAGGGDMRRRRGYEQQSLFTPTTPLPANNMYGASRDAYDYLMGVNPTSGGGQYPPYDPNRPYDPMLRGEIPEKGMQPDPNTPKTGTGKYVFDPVTRQYKWVPDPIKPVDIAPVFENKDTPLNHGKSDADRAEQQAKINAYFDNMTPEQREEHAANLRKGMDVLGNLMPGSWIPKAANAVQTFFKEQQLKDIYAKEVADKEAKRAQEESNNLLNMIQFTNEETPYTPPQGDPAQQQQAEARESAARAAATSAAAATGSPFSSGTNVGFSGAQFSGSTPTAPGYTSSQFSGEGLNGVQVGPPSPSPTPTPAPAPSDPGQGDGSGNEGRGGRDAGGGGGGWIGRNADPGDHGYGSTSATGGLATQYGFQHMAHGGIADIHQYNLGSYSDGGRLLKGPGDGVSDDIPATIGHGQPARLADGEFVIPARIVSEIGNGSTDAGARELYKMMDRIQAGRKKTVGKDQVAKNSKAVRHLPA